MPLIIISFIFYRNYGCFLIEEKEVGTSGNFNRVGWGTFFADTRNGIVWPTMDAIDAAYSIGFDFDNRDLLQQTASDFAAICPTSSNVFKGVVMTVDGWVMHTRQPLRIEVEHIMSYRNRKGCRVSSHASHDYRCHANL